MNDREFRQHLVKLRLERERKERATGPAPSLSFLAANGPNQHAKRIAQLATEADKRGKAEMVDEAMQWVKGHEPAKQEYLK